MLSLGGQAFGKVTIFHEKPFAGRSSVGVGITRYGNNFTLDGNSSFLTKFHDHMLMIFESFLPTKFEDQIPKKDRFYMPSGAVGGVEI